jgi:hypothetical protein
MINRREWIALSAVPAFAQNLIPNWMTQVIERHDAGVEKLLKTQITDPNHRGCGIYADEYGLYNPGTAAGVIDTFLTAYLHPKSKYHNDGALPDRIRLAAEFLTRVQTPDGNINLLVTNFNSPPDTGFVVRALCPSVTVAKRAGKTELVRLVEPFLRKAGAGLTKGGIHTPNHRWVVSAALSQLYDLFGDASYMRRIDQWLAEGVDIDSEGQFSERSTYVYNPITDNAFVTMAAKLKRPELLGPPRRNLESMMYLLHPGYEVVTEISRRQDLNQRGDMGPYWFSLAYLAQHANDRRFGMIADHFASSRASLSALMEYPELANGSPIVSPPPEDYRRAFPHNGLVRIRRGPVSATILGGSRSRFFSLRNGDAVINAVRFASAFFGKGQFSSPTLEDKNGVIQLKQELQAQYYQPLEPPHPVNADEWRRVTAERKQTEICRLEQSATVTETPKGFRLRLQSNGTKDVPLAVEINFREGGKLEGVTPAHKVADGWLLSSGHATYKIGSDAIRFGPGFTEHSYTQVRGAEPKLTGPSVYITGLTPFDRTIEFECIKG